MRPGRAIAASRCWSVGRPEPAYRLPDELDELLDRELEEELPPDELLDEEDCDELDEDELDDDELDEDELEAVLDDELDDDALLVDELEEELLAVLELDALLVDELLDEEPAVLLDEDELLAVPDEDDELGAGELDELVPPVELLELDVGSGAVGVVVQPTMPAASTAAGAPESNSRKSRRRVRSETSLGAGACGRDESDM